MWLTAEKTKKIGYELWYQLWKHPESKYKDDLLNYDQEAIEAYQAVRFFAENCVFCEYDAQMRIKNDMLDDLTNDCYYCPLKGKNNDCCHGYFRKWALSEDRKTRKLYAKAILDLISNWKV